MDIDKIDKLDNTDKLDELFMGKKPLSKEQLDKMFEKEQESLDVTVLNNLRLDIEGEYLAIRGYEERADYAEKNGYKDIAKILRSIRDEEKVHVGELQALMDKYDKEYEESVKDGKKEAEDEE